MLATLLLATLAGGAVPDEPLPVVTYDLSDLLPREEREQRALRPFPMLMVGENSPPDFSDERFGDVPEVVSELLSTCVAREAMLLDGCDVQVREGGQLQLTAPAAAQHDAAALIGLLRSGLRRQAQVSVELLRVSDAGPVDPAAIEADLASGRLQRVLLRTESLGIGRSSECVAETRRRLVVDSEPELAQHAVTASPLLRELDTGLRAYLRVEEAGAGRFTLRCAARVSELRELPTRSEGLQASLTGDAGVNHVPALGNFERPDVAFATLAASGRVQAGETLVAASGSETLHGPVGWVLRLRLQGVDPAPAPIAASDGQHSVALFDVSCASWPHVGAPRPTAELLSPEPGDNAQPWLMFPGEVLQDPEAITRRLQVACDRAGQEAWLTRRGNWLLACTTADGVAVVAHELEALQPAAADVVVTLQATLSGESGKLRPAASLRLPLRPDDVALGWAGAEGLYTSTYEVDVAEGVSTPDPYCNGLLDGLAVRTSTAADGRASLELVLNRVLSWERVPLGASGIDAYERPVCGVVALDRELAPGQSARLDGVGDPFSSLASLSLQLGVQAR